MGNPDYTDLGTLEEVQDYAFVFVCQSGPLEIKALLLAASLKRFMRCDGEIIAVIPGPESVMGAPNPQTLDFFQRIGVRVAFVDNTLFQEDVPASRLRACLYANKIFCLGVETRAQKLIFLDSDMLFFRGFHGGERFSIPFNAKLAGMDGVRPFVGRWDEIFAACGLSTPAIRLKVVDDRTGECRCVPPYFNSGFVGIRSDLASTLSASWLDCFKTLSDPEVLGTSFLTEQVSLAVALHSLGIVYEVMSVAELPSFHYHTYVALSRNSWLVGLASSLAREHKEIADVLKGEPGWGALLS